MPEAPLSGDALHRRSNHGLSAMESQARSRSFAELRSHGRIRLARAAVGWGARDNWQTPAFAGRPGLGGKMPPFPGAPLAFTGGAPARKRADPARGHAPERLETAAPWRRSRAPVAIWRTVLQRSGVWANLMRARSPTWERGRLVRTARKRPKRRGFLFERTALSSSSFANVRRDATENRRSNLTPAATLVRNGRAASSLRPFERAAA